MPVAKLDQDQDHHHQLDLQPQRPPQLNHVDQLVQLDSLLAGHQSTNNPIFGFKNHLAYCSTSTPKLILAHDFKGGYSEDEFVTGYSFEWLGLVDIFIYFSHHRISLPPSQWIIAAHTHQTRILGTLIFEHSSASELDLLLAGPTPSPAGSKLYLSLDPSGDPTDVISTYYADRLIDLACLRQFHGWLINIELDLSSSLPARATRLSRALRIWLDYFRLEGLRRVGPAWEVSWYDSLSYHDGSLKWQSRLDARHNLPYFAAASSIFLDYHWSSDHLNATAALLASLPPAPSQPIAPETQLLRLPSQLSSLASRPHLKQAVYVGIDVFGRGCPYGGGFASWRAARDILAAGHSVALFAPGWTWESHHLHPDRQPASEGSEPWWTRWWRDERYFWTGLVEPRQLGQLANIEPPNAHVDACRIAAEAKRPPPARGTSPSELPQHEPFLTHFVARPLPPVTAFYTNWSLGAGTNGFWVHGSQHVEGIRNWSDMAMCFPIHTLAIASGTLWGIKDGVPVNQGRVQCDVTSEDGWLGSGCVEVREQVERTGQESDGVRFVWMNATNIEPKANTLTCRLVWKPRDPACPVPLGIALDAYPAAASQSAVAVAVAVADPGEPAVVVLGTDVAPQPKVTVKSLAHGWHETVFQIAAPSWPVVRLGITVRSPDELRHFVGEMSVVGEESGEMKGVGEVTWMARVAPQGAKRGSVWGMVAWKGSDGGGYDDQMAMWLVCMVESDERERLIGCVRGCLEVCVNGYVPLKSNGSGKLRVRVIGVDTGFSGGGGCSGECVCE